LGTEATPETETADGARLEVCLDFANEVPPSAGPFEYADLVAWARAAGLIDEATAARLGEAAARRPAAAAAAYDRALALSRLLYRLFGAVAAGAPAAEADLTALNEALAEALPRLRLAASAGGYAWTWADEAEALERPLWPIVRAAGLLLTSPERGHLRECASHDCRWLFLDHSRNRSRRWCSMSDCGNRAKARRHYQRRKAAGDRLSS
jgi:predicted RNA-binding Zn ribbon-like protein